MTDISELNDTIWDTGELRASVIRPLAESRVCSQKLILEAAQKLQLSERHIYKLIRKYRESFGMLTSLIPREHSGGKGLSRLADIQESLINQIIEKSYLTSQKLSSAQIVEKIQKICFEKHIDAPSESTIRRRLHTLSLIQRQKRGEDTGISTQPIVGSFPKVDYPLSVVQIDHTLVDIILVDPIDRLPIGRPYVTIAIDIYSRCIAGFVLSLEAPSAVSVGLCLTHVAMDKESWLTMHDIDASWAIHGKPGFIYGVLPVSVSRFPLFNGDKIIA